MLDTRPCALAEVESDIESRRVIHPLQHIEGASLQPNQFQLFDTPQIAHIRDVALRKQQEVPGIVGIQIGRHGQPFGAQYLEALHAGIALQYRAQDAVNVWPLTPRIVQLARSYQMLPRTDNRMIVD